MGKKKNDPCEGFWLMYGMEYLYISPDIQIGFLL